MTFVKGQKKTAGRVKGTKNKATVELEALADGESGPFRTLLNKMNDPTSSDAIVIDCAKALLAFTNRKQPIAVEADVKAKMVVTLLKLDEDL